MKELISVKLTYKTKPLTAMNKKLAEVQEKYRLYQVVDMDTSKEEKISMLLLVEKI